MRKQINQKRFPSMHRTDTNGFIVFDVLPRLRIEKCLLCRQTNGHSGFFYRRTMTHSHLLLYFWCHACYFFRFWRYAVLMFVYIRHNKMLSQSANCETVRNIEEKKSRRSGNSEEEYESASTNANEDNIDTFWQNDMGIKMWMKKR